MEKHFVEFFSPGTFVAENTVKEIESWDVDKAKEMAKNIIERYNSKPYSFRFITREKEKIIRKSGFYFINGKVETLEDVKAKNNRDDKILISNMENSSWNKIVTTFSPWRWTQPFDDSNDFVVEI